jgi:hypothetical protein
MRCSDRTASKMNELFPERELTSMGTPSLIVSTSMRPSSISDQSTILGGPERQASVV